MSLRSGARTDFGVGWELSLVSLGSGVGTDFGVTQEWGGD